MTILNFRQRGTLNFKAGVVWYRDPKSDRLIPLYHIGPSDVSNVYIESGIGIEGIVTSSGNSVLIEDASAAPRAVKGKFKAYLENVLKDYSK